MTEPPLDPPDPVSGQVVRACPNEHENEYDVDALAGYFNTVTCPDCGEEFDIFDAHEELTTNRFTV